MPPLSSIHVMLEFFMNTDSCSITKTMVDITCTLPRMVWYSRFISSHHISCCIFSPLPCSWNYCTLLPKYFLSSEALHIFKSPLWTFPPTTVFAVHLPHHIHLILDTPPTTSPPIPCCWPNTNPTYLNRGKLGTSQWDTNRTSLCVVAIMSCVADWLTNQPTIS